MSRGDTGINRGTITRLYHERAERVELESIEKLCRYRECRLEDLPELVEDRARPFGGVVRGGEPTGVGAAPWAGTVGRCVGAGRTVGNGVSGGTEGSSERGPGTATVY